MHFPAIISLLSVLAAGARAATVKRQDPHIADFRTWGKAGCSGDNQGIWTFTQSRVNGCNSFSSFGVDNVLSLKLVDTSHGCSRKYAVIITWIWTRSL